jgi:diadenosine tetraphosphatase ApaH/serine/threonine PP2A family protein phosphatase
MRYAILTDIHSNLDAFQAVIADLQEQGGFDIIWCLGDIVGYGPEPRECVRLMREYEHLCVAGNHDWACIGKISNLEFNSAAAAACEWTESELAADDIAYLAGLPETIIAGDFTLVHGSPRNPLREYLITDWDAEENLTCFDTRYCLIGHTHVPLIFEKDDSMVFSRLLEGTKIKLGENRLFINPGGVGQPRDNDPRAAYALYDSDSGVIEHFRVNYDIEATQQKMYRAGLPQSLITRLSFGR